MKLYTINAIGQNGKTYPLYFWCMDIVDAEMIIKQTGVKPNKDGVCEMEDLEYYGDN